jgi:hypothetical protein
MSAAKIILLFALLTFLCHRLNWWELAKYESGFMYYQLLDLDN